MPLLPFANARGTTTIIIGTTPISGGTSTRVLYDNAGVVGEMTTTGSGTVLVLATSPVLVTPTLGAALATSIAFGGFTALLTGDANNVVAQRNSTTAQVFRIYNTYTDASNNEFLALSWSITGNQFVMRTGKNGTGTNRNLNINYSDNSPALTVPITVASTSIVLSNTGGSSNWTNANGIVNIQGPTSTATSGTAGSLRTFAGATPTATSTLLWYSLYLNPTINYSAGTPGAGSYEALKIDVVETALPTGTNYLIRARAGAAGTTDKFNVTNAGAGTFASTITTLGGATFHTTSSALTDGAGASAGTITNAPSVGNPTKWIGINDNGTTRYIPAW